MGNWLVCIVWCVLGMWPIINLNGAFFVVLLGHVLWTYWVMGRRSAQFECWWFM